MVSVVIEPFEPMVNEAIRLIESKVPGFFSGINKVVVEQGDSGHFGRVESDKNDTIFISVGRIRNALSGSSDESKIKELALTLAHEVGHIRSNFTGGEAPAMAEENRMKDILSHNLLVNKLTKVAGLEDSGVSDAKASKPIFISTTVRVAFRSGNANYKEMRNDKVNQAAAKLFSSSDITSKFKPRQAGSKDTYGEVREGHGVKFIGIVYPTRVSVIALKGSSAVAAKRNDTNQRKFAKMHLREAAASKHSMTEEAIDELTEFLSLFNNTDKTDVLNDINNEESSKTINKLYQVVQEKERCLEMDFQPAYQHDTFSIPAGEPLSEPTPTSDL